jgi:hypothetical protein
MHSNAMVACCSRYCGYDLESVGFPVGITGYISPLRAYEKQNKSEEFNGVLQRIFLFFYSIFQ